MTNVNIFSRYLTLNESTSVTAGSLCGQAGDYLAWEDIKWTLVGEENILITQVNV